MKSWTCPQCKSLYINPIEKCTIGVWRIKFVCGICGCEFLKTKHGTVILKKSCHGIKIMDKEGNILYAYRP